MAKDVRVLIVEQDLYSRDMLTMLLTRDWRTRIVGQCRTLAEAAELLARPFQTIDVLLVGIESPCEFLEQMPLPVIGVEETRIRVIYAATRIDSRVQELAQSSGFGGFVLKEEIFYSIASAVASTVRGYSVITPGVLAILRRSSFRQPVRVLDGMRKMQLFSRREAEIIHLGVLLNMPQRDIADELLLGRDWISEAIGNVYAKLGIHDLLSGEQPLSTFFEDDTVIAHVEKILERSRSKGDQPRARKAPWMSTLAFHLLTAPTILD